MSESEPPSMDQNHPEIEESYLSESVIQAVRRNDVLQLKSLHDAGEPFGLRNQYGNNLLHIAISEQVYRSTLHAFKYLLTLPEIDKNLINTFKVSPLMAAFSNEIGETYALLLIESGCETSHIVSKDPLLHMAVENNWIKVTKYLLDRGLFLVDEMSDSQETALHIASRRGSVNMIWTLLEYGADPTVTHIDVTRFFNIDIHTTFSCYDYVMLRKNSPEVHKIFFQELEYEKSFSLQRFIEVMQNEDDFFYKMMEFDCELNYIYDDLKTFTILFSTLNSQMFELFMEDYSYVVEEVLQRCCLDDMFICDNPKYLQNFTENLLILIESDILEVLVEEMNSRSMPLLSYLIESFNIHTEFADNLSKILCALLSYGVNMSAEAMISIYLNFGYCDLFKIMLHMDIEHTKRCVANRHILPRIIFDMDININSVVSNEYDGPTAYKLSQYFTLKAVGEKRELYVPCLVELARNSLRNYIIHIFNIKNSRQFYTVLNKLPIPVVYKKIVSLEQKLYRT